MRQGHRENAQEVEVVEVPRGRKMITIAVVVAMGSVGLARPSHETRGKLYNPWRRLTHRQGDHMVDEIAQPVLVGQQLSRRLVLQFFVYLLAPIADAEASARPRQPRWSSGQGGSSRVASSQLFSAATASAIRAWEAAWFVVVLPPRNHGRGRWRWP